MHPVRPTFRLLALAGLVSAGPVLAQADPGVMPLVPHHAMYKLSLLKSTGAKAPEAVDGLLSYDFTGSACDGYTMTLRQMTALQPQEGEAHVTEMQTGSFEGGDGQDYKFKVSNTGDTDPEPSVDGTAHRASDGVVSVALDQPKVEALKLEPGVLFPTEHLKKVLATAKAGGKLLSATVFDGSDTGKKVFNTLSVIGAEATTPPSEKAAQIEPLSGIRRWPVAISYFDQAKPDTPPDYVLSFDLYEDGISRALKLDYGDFVLAGDLTDLKILPESSCTK